VRSEPIVVEPKPNNLDQPGAFKAKLAGPTTRPLDTVQSAPTPRKSS
jgi:hypothetical protein